MRLPITSTARLLLITALLAHSVALLLPIHRNLRNVNVIVIDDRTVHVDVDILQIVYDYLMVHWVDRRVVGSRTGGAAGTGTRVCIIWITSRRLRGRVRLPRRCRKVVGLLLLSRDVVTWWRCLRLAWRLFMGYGIEARILGLLELVWRLLHRVLFVASMRGGRLDSALDFADFVVARIFDLVELVVGGDLRRRIIDHLYLLIIVRRKVFVDPLTQDPVVNNQVLLYRRALRRIGLRLIVGSLRILINQLQSAEGLKILRPRRLIILADKGLVVQIILRSDYEFIPRHFWAKLLIFLRVPSDFVIQRRLNNIADNLRRRRVWQNLVAILDFDFLGVVKFVLRANLLDPIIVELRIQTKWRYGVVWHHIVLGVVSEDVEVTLLAGEATA